MAGGFGEDKAGGETVHSDVYVLDNLNSTWGKLGAELPTNMSNIAGLLVGNYLLCFGGSEFPVSGSDESRTKENMLQNKARPYILHPLS